MSASRATSKPRRLHFHETPLGYTGWVLLSIYSLLILALFFWAIVASFKDDFDFLYDPLGFPSTWQFSNYKVAFTQFSVTILTASGGSRDVYLPEMLLNSFLYSFGSAVVNTLVCCVVGYVASKYPHKKLSHILYVIVIVAVIFPAVGSLPSEIQMARALHTYGNLFGVYFMKANFLGMNFLIFYSAFKDIPWDYAEAGFVDGASHFTVMTRLMIPMIWPVVMTVFLLSFIGYWNDYYTPMIYLPNMPTAAYGLYLYQFSSNNETSAVPMQLAGCMIVFLPVFVLFLCFKNKLIGNLTVGGLKG